MSEKPSNYRILTNHLDIQPEQFITVENSLKSDILPVLEIGCRTFHIPFNTLWEQEIAKEAVVHPNFKEL